MPDGSRMEAARRRMQDIDTPNQILGRTQTIGCVAVEITQKCNLDCTLCYLSEHSQQVHDIPLDEVYRRLDVVLEEYGEGTHVQITGGDPTLRKHTELIEIVRYARSIGLFPAMFTNGIGATRKLLVNLAEAGLADIAFHVDTTQRRKGIKTEADLHAVRKEYLERCRGLNLMVIFNTTVHEENIRELPKLIQFFAQHADMIGLASFNLQAETGRGEWRSRELEVSQASVRKLIEQAAGKELPWDAVRIGHKRCHNYLPTVVCNDNIHAAIDDPAIFAKLLSIAPTIGADRHLSGSALFLRYAGIFLKNPSTWLPAMKYALTMAKRLLPDFIKGRGRINKLTFFVQNFMDAKELDEERINACSFMVITAKGPVSMCEHNARRDEFILQPLKVKRRDGSVEHYDPLNPARNKRKKIAGATS